MRRPIVLRVACAALGLASSPAAAASLRGEVLLRGPSVTLADLFDGAPQDGRVLGPAPAPGGRVIVEAAQLAAIARQFGVAWQPGSAADHAVLERPGRPADRALLVEALRAALGAAGAAPDTELDLTGFNAPLVPPETTPDAAVTQIDLDATSGRFTALLSVTAAGMDPANLRIAGRAVPTRDVLVATRRLLPGDVLRPEDVRLDHVRAPLVRGDAAGRPSDVVGMMMRRAAAPGQPLLLADMTRAVLVQRRMPVMMEVAMPGLALTARGEAQEDGVLGARIRVLNTLSKAVVEAEVIGDGRVRVSPGSTPIVPAGRAGNAP